MALNETRQARSLQIAAHTELLEFNPQQPDFGRLHLALSLVIAALDQLILSVREDQERAHMRSIHPVPTRGRRGRP